ncbi:hypothetical protein [uncultured Helicobacter sp.]|uniref:hypothetical protein n=1 Tax=uncultured Helicobacter sp. TaxID=175537 RepID=UPI002632B2BB|nr:hypothetical protein [uncultured Helicobacter sp.]
MEAKEINNNDNTSMLTIESLQNLLEYQGNTSDTLMSGLSGVFASMNTMAEKLSGSKGKIISYIFQTQGASVSLTYNYGNNGKDMTKALVGVGIEVIVGWASVAIASALAAPVWSLVSIAAIAAVGISLLLNTQAGKVGVQWASEKIKPLITNIESKIRDFFNRFDSNPSSYELVKNPSLESKDYKSLIELLLDNHSTAQDINTLLHSFPNYLKVDSKDSTPLDSTIEFYLKESLLKPDKVNAHRKGEIHFTFQILNEDATTPISNAEIQLQNVNLRILDNPKNFSRIIQ